MKYEPITKDRDEKTYGVWNNGMCAFQYIDEWNGTETLDLEEAVRVANLLNGIS